MKVVRELQFLVFQNERFYVRTMKERTYRRRLWRLDKHKPKLQPHYAGLDIVKDGLHNYVPHLQAILTFLLEQRRKQLKQQKAKVRC